MNDVNKHTKTIDLRDIRDCEPLSPFHTYTVTLNISKGYRQEVYVLTQTSPGNCY